MKNGVLSILFALATFATSNARAEAKNNDPLFDRCIAASAQLKAAPKTLDLDLLERAIEGAEQGNMQCAGVAQRVLLTHAKHLGAVSARDFARIESAYARGFAAFGTPELRIAHDKLAMIASAR